MRAQLSAPDGFVEAGGVTLDRRLKRLVTLASIPWTIASLCIVGALGSLRPMSFEIRPDDFSSTPVIGVVLGLVVAMPLVIIAHEAVHGVFLWWLIRRRPSFGFRGWYAFAAAPGWYFSRSAFVLVALAPAVGLTAVAMGLYYVLPGGPALFAMYAAILNLVGSIGDLYLAGRVLRLPRNSLVQDRIDGVAWYRPASSATAEAPLR